MIHYLTGDATAPRAEGHKLIVHVCNVFGGWGAGFVLAVSRRWIEPERAYRSWYQTRLAHGSTFALGEIQVVPVGGDISVVNMLAQGSGSPPIRYDALANCLAGVAGEATRHAASVHMPRIGCGLAGGSWDRVEPLIAAALSGSDCLVYDLPERA